MERSYQILPRHSHLIISTDGNSDIHIGAAIPIAAPGLMAKIS